MHAEGVEVDNQADAFFTFHSAPDDDSNRRVNRGYAPLVLRARIAALCARFRDYR
jgi:hypothetical protein